MANGVPATSDVAALVDRMFADVLTPEERVELLAWIRAWEAANPGATSAERVTGWIDVAYAFQARGRDDSPAAAARVRPATTSMLGHA